MGELVMELTADEILGLTAVVTVYRAKTEPDADLEGVARAMMTSGLKAELTELGLPWAPSADAAAVAAAAAATRVAAGGLRASLANPRVRAAAGIVGGIALVVVLWGGYGQGWGWTGFAGNDQLWDWLHLLLLPVAFATLPIWIADREQMSRARQLSYALAVAAFAGFIALGYLVPLSWTGFPGNRLWDWLTLIMLPVTLITIRAWPTTGRQIRGYHIIAAGLLGTGWIVTLVGGYGLGWSWTGYQGNTLWDWLSLLLLPAVFPTILLPATTKWISGNAAQRAETARLEAKKAALHTETRAQQSHAGGRASEGMSGPHATTPSPTTPTPR